MAALKSIHIHELLRLRDIHVDLEEAGVTAIMGANGTGKTTFLQALACIYQKDRRINLEHDQYNQTDFFKDYEDNSWQGSQYDVAFFEDAADTSYICDANSWQPRIQNKKQRYTKYISILECVPDQEKESANIIDNFSTNEFSNINEGKKRTLINKVSGALNRRYLDTQIASKETGLESFMHVKVSDRSLGEISYPSHYMGAGEQKIIHIMKEVLCAPNKSLILIEELEISLHESAIRSLISFLIEQTRGNRKLQIVFTSHWLGLQNFTDDLNVVSLYVEPETEIVTIRNGFDPQFIHNLNNDYEQLRQIKVWVEDSLAQKIVEHVAHEMGIMEFLSIKQYGAIKNAYTIAGSIAMSGESTDRTIILTDGDSYLTDEEKRQQIGHVVSGNGDMARNWRDIALSLIVDLASPQQQEPESVLLQFCLALIDEQEHVPVWVFRDNEWLDLQIPRPTGKAALNHLRNYKNMTMDRLESMYLSEACRSREWSAYVEPLVIKIREAVRNIGIPINQVEEVAA